MTSTYIKRNFFCGLAIAFVLMPFFVSAQEGGTPPPPSKTGITYVCPPKEVNGQKVYGECTFGDIISAIKKIINWATGFALAFSVVVLAVAGGKYMISGDNPGQRKEANDMLLKVVKGIVFVLAAWLIVTLITGALLKSGYNLFLG